MRRKRRLNAGSSQILFCYTAHELHQYKFGKVDGERRLKIFHHLRQCDPCRGLYEALKSEKPRDVQSGGTFSHSKVPVKLNLDLKPPLPVPLRLEPGQIWTTTPQPKNRNGKVIVKVPMSIPVAIVSAGNGMRYLDNMIKVVPISCDTDYCLKGDSLKLVQTIPLGYPILLEAFNGRLMLAGNLVEFRGDICPSDRKRLCRMHQQYQNKYVKGPDSEYLVWKNNEILLAGYLGYAVDRARVKEKTEIELVPYRKAADDRGITLSEIEAHILMKTEAFSMAIVQKRDKVFLRNVLEKISQNALYIDGHLVKLKKKSSGVCDVLIGYVDQIAPSMDVYTIINDEAYLFGIRFCKKGV